METHGITIEYSTVAYGSTIGGVESPTVSYGIVDCAISDCVGQDFKSNPPKKVSASASFRDCVLQGLHRLGLRWPVL